MPELTVRNVAFAVLITASLAAVLAAVSLLARQDDNSPISITSPTSQAAPSQVRVFVNGAVASPGVYTLAPDSRITDALDAAGGATGEADLTGVNLALRLRDEDEYYFPKVGEAHPKVRSWGRDRPAA